MEICKTELCSGCGVCRAVCPQQCIDMREDGYGVVYPSIDHSRCVKCNQCLKICPSNSAPSFSYPRLCYAAWMDDASKRLLCASGGVGTCIAEFVVKEKNGVVFGTAYDVDMVPRVVAVERMEDIERLKGSKYVQSVVGNEMYSQIKAMLDMGRFVAFIGTPCQVAAVRRFLNKSYENFISVDLICHGVSPLSYFQGELKRIKAKVGDVDIATIRFRGNDEYNYKLSAWSPDGCRYVVDWNDSCYFAGFLWGGDFA